LYYLKAILKGDAKYTFWKGKGRRSVFETMKKKSVGNFSLTKISVYIQA